MWVYIFSRELDVSYRKVYTQGAGIDFGLELIVDVGVSSYVTPLAPYYGIYVRNVDNFWLLEETCTYFQFFLQDSDEYVNIYNPADTIKPNEEVSLALRPELIDSSPNVRSLPLDIRNCLFYDEVIQLWYNKMLQNYPVRFEIRLLILRTT